MGKFGNYLAAILGIFSVTASSVVVLAGFPSLKDKLPLGVIVQLKGLNLPRPQTTGETIISLYPIEGSEVFAVDVQMEETQGRFLFDTGASTTIIGTPLATDLGLVGKPMAGDRIESVAAGDDCPSMDAILHNLPRMEMGEVEVMGLQGLEFPAKMIPDGLSGVLGMDVLAEFDLGVNPDQGLLQLLSPSDLPLELSEVAIPLESRLGVMLAEVAIANRGEFQFMLDTGADTIFISEDLAHRLEIDPAATSNVQVLGFCGLESAQLSTLATVAMGPYQLNNLEAVILSSPSVLDLLEVDGILGQSFLNNYKQYWRFDRQSSSEDWGGSLLLIP